jgi:aryl carrier-like protein
MNKLILKSLLIVKYTGLFFIVFFCFTGPNGADNQLIDESKEFEMIENIMFKRLDSAIQERSMNWAEEYKKKFGEKAFETLLTRYMKTESFKKNSILAFRLQNTEEAKNLYHQIEILSKLAKEKNQEWKNSYRKSRNSFLFDSKDTAQDLISKRQEAERAYRELVRIIARHNQLVSEYNKNYRGGLEFIDQAR